MKPGWSPLIPGAVVDLIAPGSACSKEDLERAAELLRSWKLEPRYSPSIFKNKTPIVSAPLVQRYQDLRKALTETDSSAVWCIRGGYGSLHLLPALNRLKRPRKMKVFIGYSDITSLHSFLLQKWGWPTIHGPVLERLGKQQMTPKERKALRELLFGRQKKCHYSLKAMNASAQKQTTIRSSVVGGNLSVLQSAIGTPWEIQLRGRFLFIEDIGEKPHRIDRMLNHFLQAGIFKGCQGLLLGDFLLEDRKLRSLLWKEVLGPFAKNLKIPVLRGLPCGHGSVQMPLPFGTKAQLQLGSSPSLIVDAGSK